MVSLHTQLARKYIPVLALRVALQLVLDHVDHDLVADQTTLVHDLLSLPSEVGLLRDLRAQHVTGSLGGILSAARI